MRPDPFPCRALFAPSCIAHTVLTKRNWAAVKIGDVSLPHALYCWDITPFAKLTARRQHAAGGRGAEVRATEEEEQEEEREMVNAAGEEEDIRGAGRRGHRHQNRGDRKSKRHRHTGGRRRTGERNRRRQGRRRNRKGRRRSNGRARTQDPEHGAPSQTEEGSGVPQGKGIKGEGSDARDSGTSVGGVVTQEVEGHSNLGGEMLADSPKNPTQDSFVVESNAIDASQDGSTARTGSRGAGRKKSGTRRRRRRGKKRSKERERKLRKRERRRKKKERRRKRLQQEKRRKRKERRQGKYEYITR